MQIFKKLAWLDRLKKWEPVRHKNERAYFCAPGLPIVPKAQPWDPRPAGFPAILVPIPGILEILSKTLVLWVCVGLWLITLRELTV